MKRHNNHNNNNNKIIIEKKKHSSAETRSSCNKATQIISINLFNFRRKKQLPYNLTDNEIVITCSVDI